MPSLRKRIDLCIWHRARKVFFFLLRIYAKIHDCAVVGWAAFNFEKKKKSNIKTFFQNRFLFLLDNLLSTL